VFSDSTLQYFINNGPNKNWAKLALQFRVHFRAALASAVLAACNTMNESAMESLLVYDSEVVGAYGVVVGLYPTVPGATGTTNPRRIIVGSNPNPIYVSTDLNINPFLPEKQMAANITHEGRHAMDLFNYVYNNGSDYTQYERESRSYLAGSYVAQGVGMARYPFVVAAIGELAWNSKWRADMRGSLRNQGIANFLADPRNGYYTVVNGVNVGLSSSNLGPTYSQLYPGMR
jgi:hypothetical protein